MTSRQTPRRIRAVLFDLGGVVLGSPLHAISRYERAQGVEPGLINRVVVSTGDAGAWSRLERGELTLEAFFAAFEADCAVAGARISARALMQAIGASAEPRPNMLEAVRRVREQGLRAAALTNNWAGEGDATRPLRPHFDAFVESSALGWRKPDPRIYRYACERLGVPAAATVFLDDIGRNLKPARELGMATIKVEDPDAALAELGELLGFPLGKMDSSGY